MSLSNLRKSNSLDKLLNAVEKETAPVDQKSYKDDRLWKPEMGKDGNGYAVIRFLPAPEGEDMPWVRLFSHAFQGPTGKWFIENSLTTMNQKDPVSEYNTQLWNTGVEADKELARKQKRKLQYYSNILVVSDPKHPENEGKVFLYRYGKKIFDKLMEAMQPAFEDETAVNPFDFWEGADFKLKLRMQDGYWNYDKSEFSTPSEIAPSDEEIESIWKQTHSLQEIVAPDQFKSYDELKARLDEVLSGTVSTGVTANELESDDLDVEDKQFVQKTVQKSEPVATEDDDDDALSYFQKLANE
jgi:hypothetical protein